MNFIQANRNKTNLKNEKKKKHKKNYKKFAKLNHDEKQNLIQGFKK